MSSLKHVALGVFSLLGLAGCNSGQPRIYRVAVDRSPINTSLPPSCYRVAQPNGGIVSPVDVNYRQQEQWVVWEGVEKVEYLDMGSTSFKLGDSPKIDVTSLIEGKEKVFAASHAELKAVADQYTEQRRMTVTVKFDDYSFAPKGTVALKSEYACSGPAGRCPTGEALPADGANCEGLLSFVARRVDAQQVTFYENNPQ